MAKDLTQMPTEKLFRRAVAALQEIGRRLGQPGEHEHEHETEPGFRIAREHADPTKRAEQVIQTSHRLPKADPWYLSQFQRAQARPAPSNEVAMADKNGIIAPTMPAPTTDAE